MAWEASNGMTLDRRLVGDRSWTEGIGVLPPELHRDAVRYASTKLMTLLRHRNVAEVPVSYLGSETVDGRKIEVVKIVLEGTRCEIELDHETFRPVAVRFQSSPIQEAIENEVVRRSYSDFRSVNGFVLPFRQTVTVGGEYYNEWQLLAFETEPEYDSKVFDF
ncbi:MAG: hypothetical protein MPN21_14900 [Thermoanaerobaculia bacterium]|nr:hypothetical protein [Thermoanaerobaculia bacterium]